LGNVYEWTATWYASYSDAPATDPEGPSRGTLKVLRGGSWSSSAKLVRVSLRDKSAPGNHDDYMGFRCSGN
jgi:sulfatase modifying factor 1